MKLKLLLCQNKKRSKETFDPISTLLVFNTHKETEVNVFLH